MHACMLQVCAQNIPALCLPAVPRAGIEILEVCTGGCQRQDWYDMCSQMYRSSCATLHVLSAPAALGTATQPKHGSGPSMFNTHLANIIEGSIPNKQATGGFAAFRAPLPARAAVLDAGSLSSRQGGWRSSLQASTPPADRNQPETMQRVKQLLVLCLCAHTHAFKGH